MQLYHLHIEARDVAESAAVYEEYFGLRPTVKFHCADPSGNRIEVRSDGPG